ncbi:MAG: flagellar biosynthetic protein FliR [Planctomycetota bacterium]
MGDLESELLRLGVVFTLVLARVGAVVASAPLLSDASLPARVKALLAVSLSALVTPMVLADPGVSLAATEAPRNLAGLGVLVGGEAIVGLTLGLAVTVLLSGVQLAGQLVGQMSGMALAETSSSPFGDSSTVFGQVYYLVATAVFVACGGHRMLVEATLDTFAKAPPGQAIASEELLMGVIGLLGVGFELGVRAAAPLLLALLLATVVLGLISRTMPQINTMVVGFGVNALLMLGVMTASIGAAAWAFQAPIAHTLESLVASVGAG